MSDNPLDQDYSEFENVDADFDLSDGSQNRDYFPFDTANGKVVMMNVFEQIVEKPSDEIEIE